MSKILYRWGRSAARHPWRMIGAWLVVVIAVVGLQRSIGDSTSDNFNIPGTEAQRGIDLLNERFPSQGGSSGQVVFADPDGDVTDATARAADRGHARRDRRDPERPRRSAIRSIRLPRRSAPTAASRTRPSATASTRRARPRARRPQDRRRDRPPSAGLQAEMSRNIVRTAEQVEGKEGIGLIVAIVVLLVAFGSVIAVGLPIGTALFGIFIGLVADRRHGRAHRRAVDLTAAGDDDRPRRRHRLRPVHRHPPPRVPARGPLGRSSRPALANATAGRRSLFAGTTVVIAIAGLRIAGIPPIATMGLASAIIVAVAMVAAVTLLPALLGFAGHRIDSLARRAPPRRGGRRRTSTFAGRWADHVGSHPWRYAIVSFVGLVALAAPGAVHADRRWPTPARARPATTYRKAYDLLADGLRPGLQRPADGRRRRRRRRCPPRPACARRIAVAPTASSS